MIKHLHLYLLLIISFFTGSVICRAQNTESVVRPISESALSPVMCDIYLYGAYSTLKHSNFWTANNTSSNNKDLHGTYIDLGGTVEFYKKPELKLGSSLGYKYERFAYNNSLMGKYGINTHWLSTDLNLLWSFMSIGVHSDILMNANTKNDNNFSYVGLKGDCFNRISLCYYVGYELRFTDFNISARVGFYHIPTIDPDRVSYYNLEKTYVNDLLLEVRLAYRIFSTKKYMQSHSMF